MAAIARRLQDNVAGDFFVDASCIDCGTCRRVAPESFSEGAGGSRVYRQPDDAAAIARAEMALVACPVGAIGTATKHDLGAARAAFPEPIEDEVFFCGWAAESSYGAASYLIRRAEGNVLIDSPRFARPLVERLKALGGVRHMFLSHIDDVADHASFAREFGCGRILHARDLRRGLGAIEQPIAGDGVIAFAPNIQLIPTPGHTAGSMCLLYRDRFLFTGDHLAAGRDGHGLRAFRDYCWHDWATQIASMRRLAQFRFAWVLPGHGGRLHLPADRMRRTLLDCVDWMEGNQRVA